MPAPFHSFFPTMGTGHRVRLVGSLLDTFPRDTGPLARNALPGPQEMGPRS